MDLYVLGAFHGIIFVFLALVILYADHQGYLYVRGKKELLTERFVQWSHRLVWLGLALMIGTGAILLAPTWEYHLQQPAFYIKMGFVLVLLMNAFAIGSYSKLAYTKPFAVLSKEQQKTLLVAGALSLTGWVGSAIIGMFLL